MLELLRADIDNSILPLVASQTWKQPDFPITPESIVRLQPTLAAVVAQRAKGEQNEVDQAVGWFRNALEHKTYGARTVEMYIVSVASPIPPN